MFWQSTSGDLFACIDPVYSLALQVLLLILMGTDCVKTDLLGLFKLIMNGDSVKPTSLHKLSFLSHLFQVLLRLIRVAGFEDLYQQHFRINLKSYQIRPRLPTSFSLAA